MRHIKNLLPALVRKDVWYSHLIAVVPAPVLIVATASAILQAQAAYE